MQNLVKQNQAQAKALQAVSQGEEQRANVETSIKAQKAGAEIGKTQADTEHTQVLTAAEAQQIGHQAVSPHPGIVVPFQQPPKGAA